MLPLDPRNVCVVVPNRPPEREREREREREKERVQLSEVTVSSTSRF